MWNGSACACPTNYKESNGVCVAMVLDWWLTSNSYDLYDPFAYSSPGRSYWTYSGNGVGIYAWQDPGWGSWWNLNGGAYNGHPSTYPGIKWTCDASMVGAQWAEEGIGGGYAYRHEYECSWQ